MTNKYQLLKYIASNSDVPSHIAVKVKKRQQYYWSCLYLKLIFYHVLFMSILIFQSILLFILSIKFILASCKIKGSR